jgi:hypothetical protein
VFDRICLYDVIEVELDGGTKPWQAGRYRPSFQRQVTY